jgi:hypothetical protein
MGMMRKHAEHDHSGAKVEPKQLREEGSEVHPKKKGFQNSLFQNPFAE